MAAKLAAAPEALENSTLVQGLLVALCSLAALQLNASVVEAVLLKQLGLAMAFQLAAEAALHELA